MTVPGRVRAGIHLARLRVRVGSHLARLRVRVGSHLARLRVRFHHRGARVSADHAGTPMEARTTPGSLARRRGPMLAGTASSVLLVAGLVAACGGSDPTAPPQSLGAVIPAGHAVPATPLVDQNGRPVTLRSFHGKYVVLAQFLTLCQDECPITTGAFQTCSSPSSRPVSATRSPSWR